MKLVDFGRQAPAAARQAWELSDEEIERIGSEPPAEKPPLTAIEQAKKDVAHLGVLVEFDKHTMTDREYEFAWDDATDKIITAARESGPYRKTALFELKANGLLDEEYEIVREEFQEVEHKNPEPAPHRPAETRPIPQSKPQKHMGLDR